MLAAKVSQLHREAVVAERIASFWQKQIDLYGELKAEEFYTVKLGLNHLGKKQFEWEGMTLSREPTDAEKVCIKGVAQAQESGKESIKPILMDARAELIDSAMVAIKKLEPANYHELAVTVPDKFTTELRAQVEKIFIRGAKLVVTELSKGKSDSKQEPTDDDDEELDELVDLTDSRLANDVQSRITSAATRFALLGLTGKALWDAVSTEVNTGSVSYIDRSATGLANKVLNLGRYREMQDRKDDIGRYEYSAILDQNTCPPCAEDDGLEASSPDDLPDTPNPECEGSDFCRCFIVAVLDTVA